MLYWFLIKTVYQQWGCDIEEKGKINYDQPIRQYFPELPECYQPVTIRNMLQHTSGLALFDDFLI